MKLPLKPKDVSHLEFTRTLTPYVFAQRLVKGKFVLDIGCGLGHGTWLLANGAGHVITIDLDKAKINQVNGFFSRLKNCRPLVMDAQRLGFKDRSFQVITCFEVIEHIPKPDLLLSEIRRILRTDGVLLLTTPNRAVRLHPFQRPWNKEHLREYTLRSFRKTLKRQFSSIELLGIYGKGNLHKHYKAIWKQKLLYHCRDSGILIMRNLIPKMARRWIRSRFDGVKRSRPTASSPALLSKTPFVSNPEHWPFYLSGSDENCLNFFASCSFDDHIIQRSIDHLTGVP
jgi:ubiquinone/menaquinone biosynthesis C-methylase UbiE